MRIRDDYEDSRGQGSGELASRPSGFEMATWKVMLATGMHTRDVAAVVLEGRHHRRVPADGRMGYRAVRERRCDGLGLGLDGDNADEVITMTLRRVVATGNYLDSGDGASAVAAATIVASAADGDADAVPPEVIEYLKRAESPDEDLVATAIAALDRVTGAQSEVAELWDETDDGPEWKSSVGRLRDRLLRHV